MNPRLNVHLLPALVAPESLTGHTCLMIDVLRASTTITTALEAGVTAVSPCLTVDDAKQQAASTSDSLLGGERGGKRLPGFDLGNSPAEYTPATVGGKRLVFTTTNGTKALQRCQQADSVLIAALVNRNAICERIADAGDISIICAGTDGAISSDDVLTAGAIVTQLTSSRAFQMNDSARLAAALWRQTLSEAPSDQPADVWLAVVRALEQSQGGRNLVALGMESDLSLAAAVDSVARVPELNLDAWVIR